MRLAVNHTAEKRDSLEILNEYVEVCNELLNEEAVYKLWLNYIKENTYAAHLGYVDVVNNVLEVGKYLE